MASATATRRARAEAAKAVQEAAADAPKPEARHARRGDLGPAEKAFEDVPLQQHRDENGMAILVRVRYLSTAEVVQLSYVPDITGIVEQMSEDLKKRKGGDAKARATKPLGEWLAQQTETQARVSHVAIADPDKPEVSEPCAECTEEAGGSEVRHRPSLFSIVECGGLTHDELETVVNVALKRQGGAFLRPFSAADSPTNSEQSAVTGA